MNWTKWSSIAEIVSSIAILMTLIYLTLEIRQNTDAIQADAREGAMQGDVGWLYQMVQDPELNILLNQREPLTEAEATKLQAYLIAFMRLKEVNYLQYKTGVLDPESWANYQTSIVNGPLASRNGRNWWFNFGSVLFDRELAAQISEALKAAPPQGAVADAFAPADVD
jgi:hypothetical protein